MVIVLSLLLPFGYISISHLYTKWSLLTAIANADCKFTFRSDLSIDSPPLPRNSSELSSFYGRLYVVIAKQLCDVDVSQSDCAPIEVLTLAEIVGKSKHVRMFVISTKMRNRIGVRHIQSKLDGVPLAVVEVQEESVTNAAEEKPDK